MVVMNPRDNDDASQRTATTGCWRSPFAVWTFLLTAGAAVTVFAGWLLLSMPSEDQLMYRRLFESVRTGQTTEQVQETLGGGTLLTSHAVPQYLDQQIADKWEGDRIRENDEFLYYAADDANGNTWDYYLQFRESLLINFDHREYSTYDEAVTSVVQ